MSYKQNLKYLIVCLALILSAGVSVFGCWCRDPAPVLDEFEKAKSVIVGRLTSVGANDATILVERDFKGELKIGEQLKFRLGQFTDCVIAFRLREIGQQYLFYLNDSSEMSLYEASVCNRSNQLAQAFDDLAYLNKIDKVAGKTRLSGCVRALGVDPPSLEDLVVKITRKKGKDSYSVNTDKNGFFEIYDLSPGDYVIEPQIPVGWRIDAKSMFGVDSKMRLPITSYLETIKSKRHTATRITIIRDNVTAADRSLPPRCGQLLAMTDDRKLHLGQGDSYDIAPFVCALALDSCVAPN